MQAQQTIHAIEEPAQEPVPLRSIREIVADLSKPIPERHLRQRQQGGKTITYIPWWVAVKYMNHYCPQWGYQIKSVVVLGDRVAVTASVNVQALEGMIVREAVGIEDLDCGAYGDPTSNASSMALRRACAMFGLNLDSYER
jgi:Rad52/22 family double-strand break repair protein